MIPNAEAEFGVGWGACGGTEAQHVHTSLLHPSFLPVSTPERSMRSSYESRLRAGRGRISPNGTPRTEKTLQPKRSPQTENAPGRRGRGRFVLDRIGVKETREHRYHVDLRRDRNRVGEGELRFGDREKRVTASVTMWLRHQSLSVSAITAVPIHQASDPDHPPTPATHYSTDRAPHLLHRSAS